MTDQSRSGSVLPILRLLVLAGLGVSAYLFYVSFSGADPAGCGEGESGCSEILSSEWSSVLGVPVAGLALLAYVVLLFASVHAGGGAPAGQQEKAWLVMSVLGVAAGASGLWFIGVQFIVLDGVCLYCMVVHGCSLAIAGLLLWRVRGWRPWSGVVPVALLVGVQLIFPGPGSLGSDLRGTDVGDLELSGGPVLGDPEATVQIVVLYDYNCRYCRNVHMGVRQALEKYEGQLSVLMLPTALDPACNHAVKKKNPGSGTSCELSRLALAVWIAEPEQFEAFDRRVVETIQAEVVRGNPEELVAMLRGYAIQLAGQRGLEEALLDPRLERQLHLAAELYGKAVDPETGNRGLPRVIVSGKSYAGILDTAMLFDLLEQSEGLGERP